MITFHKDTSEQVARALTNAKFTGTRVRIWYGDTTTGKAWPEEHDIIGYVGNSTGSIKAPLLVHNKRSMGGPAILDQCIVRIDTTRGYTLYKHTSFTTGDWRLSYTPMGVAVIKDGGTHAVFNEDKSEHKARLYIAFMRGERYSK